MTTLKLRVSVHPGLRGEPMEEERNLGGYDVEAVWADDSREMSMTFVRRESIASFDPGPFRAGLEECFGYSGAGHYTFCRSMPKHLQLYANSLPLAVSRIVNAIFTSADGSWIPLRLEVRNGRGPGFVLNTEVLLSYDDPFVFPASSSFETLEAVCEVADAVDGGLRAASPAPALFVEEEASLRMGDVRAGVGGLLRGWPEVAVERDWDPPDDDTSALYNAHTYIDTDVVGKYEMLGALLRRVSEQLGGAAVLIAGDHPGVLGRYLSLHGVDSVGIDPLNGDMEDVGQNGTRRLVQGELFEDDPRGVVPPDIFECLIAVADTVTAGETAELSTERNLGIAAYAGRRGLLAFTQLRSAPRRHGTYFLLALEGHSRQGCEQYAVVGDPPFEWRKAAWCNVVVGEGGRWCKLADSGHSPWFDPFFTKHPTEDCTYLVPDEQWYNFVITRAWIEGYVMRDPVARVSVAAKSGLDILLGTAVLRGGMSELERRGLRNLFDPAQAVDTAGLPSGLLARVPGMRDCVSTRYHVLLELCAPSMGVAPPPLLAFFNRARNANLLHRLSAVRAVLGFDLELALYSRLLPYEMLACLGARPLFLLVWRYLKAHRVSTGKQYHPWELQKLLWGLTHFGTTREKYRYVLMLLEDVVTQPRRGRSPVQCGDGARHAYRTFIGRLRELDLSGAYADIDARWARYQAAHPSSARGSGQQSPVPSFIPPRRGHPQSSGGQTHSQGGSVAGSRKSGGFSALSSFG